MPYHTFVPTWQDHILYMCSQWVQSAELILISIFCNMAGKYYPKILAVNLLQDDPNMYTLFHINRCTLLITPAKQKNPAANATPIDPREIFLESSTIVSLSLSLNNFNYTTHRIKIKCNIKSSVYVDLTHRKIKSHKLAMYCHSTLLLHTKYTHNRASWSPTYHTNIGQFTSLYAHLKKYDITTPLQFPESLWTHAIFYNLLTRRSVSVRVRVTMLHH